MGEGWCSIYDSGAAMKKVVTARAVDIALNALDRAGKRQVRAWFDYLKRWDEEEILRKSAFPLPGHEGVLVLRTTTDLWIFFTIEGDTITVLDVARTRTILTSAGIDIGDLAGVPQLPDEKKDG
jgi:hypothetical protein